MKTLLVEYDLTKPGQDYVDLIAAIKDYGTWCHHLKSAWLVRTAKSTVAVRDELHELMDANDKLIVLDVTSDVAAWVGLSKEISEWIKNNL